MKLYVVTGFRHCRLLVFHLGRGKEMALSAAEWAQKATGEVLISPDWSINMELCDAINKNRWQVKDALKIIKKRLGSKRPIIQLLSLSVLDALVKNCGDNVVQQIIERGILFEMATIVKKKPNINVKEKILILIDVWQEAIGVKFPQIIQTFYSLKDLGFEFPPREESSVTLFNPPQVKSSGHSSNGKEVASLNDSISPLSMAEMKTAQELANVLMEMLNALDPNNREAINQELIVDLAEQCEGYQKRIQELVNHTSDENLLFQGLAVNDALQCILRRREEIANGVTFTTPVVSVSHLDDEADNDFSRLAPRTHARISTSNSEATQAVPYVDYPSFSGLPNSADTREVDYLTGDIYTSDKPPFKTHHKSYNFSSGSKPPSAPPSPFRYDTQSGYDELAPLPRPSDRSPPAHWETQATADVPRPAAKNELEDLSFSYDKLFISHNSTLSMDKESEDALFRDLVDFVNARASPSSSTSKRNRS